MMISQAAANGAAPRMITPPSVGPMPPLDRNGKASVGTLEVGMFCVPDVERIDLDTVNSPGISLGAVSVDDAVKAVQILIADQKPSRRPEIGYALRQAADGFYAHKLVGNQDALGALAHMTGATTLSFMGSSNDYTKLVFADRVANNFARYPMSRTV